MAAFASLILDIVIVGLLATTIGYCWLLNKRIKVLQDSKSELAQLLKYFDESTEKASESIIALQTASKKIGENIQHRVDKANYLLEDLAFMIEKGNKLADQMEAGFAVSRARAKVLGERELADAENTQRQPAVEPSGVERNVNAKQAAKAATHPRITSTGAKEKTTASLEAALERIVGRNKSRSVPEAEAYEEETEEKPATRPAQRPRSKTELELLNMLKAGLKG